MNKNDLKTGDLIYFHDWGVGGFLFGVIIEYEDDLYHSKLNIWRPYDIYFLQSHKDDEIKLITNIEDINKCDLHEFQEFMDDIKSNNIYCRFCV